MGAASFLQLGSTFACDSLVNPLRQFLARTGLDAAIRSTEPAELSQYMLAPAADSEEITGTLVLVRVEDWLRNGSPEMDDKTARKELKAHVDEFINQVSVLAMRGRPVWLLVCPSTGWVSDKFKLVSLCRTYTNLLAARLRNLPQINLLPWPESLSKDEFFDREEDRANHVPFSPTGFERLGESLAGQLAAVLSNTDSNAIASLPRAGFPELADFLRGLRLQVNVAAARASDSADVGKILRTAASFSLSGEKPTLTESEADAIVASQNCWLLRVSDRLSDFGVSGLVVTRAEAGALVVEALSLSCTVLGKQVEYALLEALKKIAAERNLTTLAFDYRESGRNQPMLAFVKSVASEDGSRRYVVPVDEIDARVAAVAAAPGAWALTAEM